MQRIFVLLEIVDDVIYSVWKNNKPFVDMSHEDKLKKT